jgi:hypothetical protein
MLSAPNSTVTWTGGGQQTATWSVSNTNNAPINAANVKLSLSTDGGLTFPVTLAASTPNDGSQTITVPNGLFSTLARVKVEAIGNIFFDLSDANFTVTPGDGCPVASRISPGVGNVGAQVTLSGLNLSGLTAVRFSNGVNAVFTVNSNTQISATVPAGAVSGPLTISKAGGAASARPPRRHEQL